MIASQKIGKSFMGALNYNVKKLFHTDPKLRAELLATNFASLDAKTVRHELNMVRSLRPNLNLYVYHTSLNFSKEDEISNTKMLEIANEYLSRNGFTNNQYFIFRHNDADHPHIHLLVNRITFDGQVVSDSNNYKKSEAILRLMENKYGLESVLPSKRVAERAVTKNELEMINRTGKISDKMLLQELIRDLIHKPNPSIPAMIEQGEKLGISFLFNQASTGRVTGITYFYNGFKIKGQSLGNQFKWAEIINKVNYEQVRDSQTISEANHRTKARYGEQTVTKPGNAAVDQRRSGIGVVYPSDERYPTQHGAIKKIGGNESTNAEFINDKSGETTDGPAQPSINANHDVGINDIELDTDSDVSIQITDDVDDEAIHGRNRHRQRKARTNTR